MVSIVKVECYKIEKKPDPQKQTVYSLTVHWSNGSKFQVEKTHSALVDLRTNLKKNYYRDRQDLHVPEVPAIKWFEIGTASKRDERKRKSIEEFFMLLYRLPIEVGKGVNPLIDFFNQPCPPLSFQDDGTYSSIEVFENEANEFSKTEQGNSLDQLKFDAKGNEKKKQKNEKGKEKTDIKQLNTKFVDTTDIGMIYSEVNKPKPTSKIDTGLNYVEVDITDLGGKRPPKSTMSSIPPDAVYAEISASEDFSRQLPQTVPPPPPKSQNAMKAPVILENASVDIVMKKETMLQPEYTEVERKDNKVLPRKYPELPKEEERKMEENMCQKDNISVLKWNHEISKIGERGDEENSGRIVSRESKLLLKKKEVSMEEERRILEKSHIKESELCSNTEEGLVKDSCIQYQNFPFVEIYKHSSLDNKRFYMATENFVPSPTYSQFLAVQNGDVVEVHAVSEDEFFCTLYVTQFRPIEGWIPKRILKPWHPERDGAFPPIKPKPSGDAESKVAPKKLMAGGDEEIAAVSFVQPSTPVTPIPPKPSVGAPCHDQAKAFAEVECMDDGEVKVVAISDYESSDENVLSFGKGMTGVLVKGDDSNWWCIRIGVVHGWVPASYWQIIQEESCSTECTKMKDAPWFVGTLSRIDCEDLLMKHGQQLDFVIRESTNLVGQFALSVKHNGHVHHFPIALTEDNKFYIGKHRFKTIDNVIFYYQRNDLYVDDDGSAVRLGNPLITRS